MDSRLPQGLTRKDLIHIGNAMDSDEDSVCQICDGLDCEDGICGEPCCPQSNDEE